MDAFATPGALAPHAETSATHVLRPRPRLFGQWLVHRGVITPADLREALALLRAVNSTIGELAVAHGLVTPAQADEINALQRHVDGRWGDIAIALGIGKATAARIEQLAWEQQLENLRLSDALVEIGVLSATEVDEWVEAFERDDATPDEIGGETRVLLDQLSDGLSRMLRRVLATPVRLSPPGVWDGHAYDHQARCVIEGDLGCMIGLSVDRRVARAMAEALLDGAAAGPGALKLDAAVGAFLVLFGGHAARRLEARGEHHPHRALPPESGQLPVAGCAVEIATAQGAALLVLSP